MLSPPPSRLQLRVGAIKNAVYESKPQMQGAGLRAAAKADAGAQVTKWRGKWRASAGGFDVPSRTLTLDGVLQTRACFVQAG